MNKEFIPYEQALALKELGFDECCFGFYFKEKVLRFTVTDKISIIKNSVFLDENNCVAPLYQQAFRWFREKYKGYHGISNTGFLFELTIEHQKYLHGILKEI